MQHIDRNEQFIKFQLTYIIALPHKKIIVNHLIETESEIKFWYWQNNFLVSKKVSEMDNLWNFARLFVKNQFVGDDDDNAIEKCFRDEDTKFIVIEHVNPSSKKSKIVSCVVFKILSKPPFGVYISYIAFNREM